MKLRKLILWDLKFQVRYGFYFLYSLISLIYIIVLSAISLQLKQKVASIMIFSDLAAIGLLFIGGIIILEKSKRVTWVFAASAIKTGEYIFSKVFALGVVSIVVSMILAVFVGINNIGCVFIGVIMLSMMFTLIGIIIATKITTINQFIMATVPIELIGFAPAILYFLFGTDKLFGLYPPNTCMDLISGKIPSNTGVVFTIALIIILFLLAKKSVAKMWIKMNS